MIDALRERGVASRAELARITGLSRSTVSTIVADLLDTGLAGERDGPAADGEAHAGRPPVMVSLNRSAGLALGIDFGHRHLRVAVSDLSHTVLAETWREMDVDHSAEEGLDARRRVRRPGARGGRRRPRPRDRGRHGPARARSTEHRHGPGRLDPARLGRRRRGRPRPASRLGLPVEVDNDANLGALAELAWGAAKGKLGGRLHQGLHRDRRRADLRRPAPTRGQRDRGRDRPHAARRERARSAAAATAAASRRSPPPARSPSCSAPAAASRSPRRGCSSSTTPGDAAAQRLIGDAGRAIGMAVANLCNLLNPECVIVGGDLSAAGERPARTRCATSVRRNGDPERGRGPRDRRRASSASAPRCSGRWRW